MRGKIGRESSALEMPVYRLFNIVCSSLSASSFTSYWLVNLKPILKRKEDIYLKQSLPMADRLKKNG